MMKGLAVVCLIIVSASVSGNQTCYSDESCLYDSLMTYYNNQVRPVTGHNGVVQVELSVSLLNILDLVERQEVLKSVLAIKAFWIDNFLSWNITKYGVGVILVDTEKLWLPDITIGNTVENFFERTYLEDFRAYITYNGRVIYYYGGIFQTTCSMNLKHYPFDKQSCTITFENWAYMESLVNLTSISFSTEKYSDNSLWHLVSTTTARDTYTSDRLTYPRLNITITLERKTTYYVLNIILPCVLITMVALAMFWLPPDCGEKISLGITVLLAYSIFQIVIMENTPVNSDHIPFISELVVFIMALSTISVLTTMSTTYFYLKKADRGIPTCMRSLVFRWLAKIVFMGNVVETHHISVHPAELDDTSFKPTVKVSNPYNDNNIQLPPIKEINMNDSKVPKNPLFQSEVASLLQEVQLITGYLKEKRKEDCLSDEWKLLAVIIDRLLFWISLFLLIVVLPIITLT